jgi:hypothetical protein
VKKVIESQKYLFLFLLLLILLIPENSGSLIPSLPVDNLLEGFLTILFLYALSKTENGNKFIIILLLCFVKAALLLQPTNQWSLCYQDDIAPRAPEEIGQSEDNKFICEKSYRLNTQGNSSYASEIDFQSINDYEWLGANASNFDLGFFNSKKFNHRGVGNFDRKWLPFELSLSNKFDHQVNTLNFVYLGELEVYKNNRIVYTGKNYQLTEQAKINNLENSEILVLYKFDKDKQIRIQDSKQMKYPPDRYAMLKVFNENMEIHKVKKQNVVKILEFLFFALLIFATKEHFNKNIFSSVVQYLNKQKFLFGYVLLLFSIIQINQLEELFPIYGIFDTLSLFIYSSLFFILYKLDLQPFETFLIVLMATYILLDFQSKFLDLHIRPGGSDALTYEHFSRLILEGNFFKGGESVFTYSPGARYILYLLHILFGEKLKFIFILLNALVAFIGVVDNKMKANKPNIFNYLLFIYLTSNAINRIFLFGMSEIFSLLIIMFFLKSNFLKTNYHYTSGLLLGIAMINRPVILLGIIALIAMMKSYKSLIGFLTISILPFIHNLYFGNSYVFLTQDWNYQGNIMGEETGVKNFVLDIFENIINNFNYVIMNPFSENIYNRTGRLLPFVFFIGLISLIYYLYLIRSKTTFSKQLISLSPILLMVAPFAIYDPSFFYPRFLIIPQTMLLIYCQDLKNEFS